jgi:ferric-dicitrate binding protein FerR (iron transport regulator)
MRVAAGILLAISITYMIFSLSKQQNEIFTDANSTKKIILEDGSIILLHFDSKLTFPKKFDSDKREVTLEGEAFFNISKDEQRPFIVHTFQTTTRVVGTEFNVRGYAKDNVIQLDVVSGLVLFGADSLVDVKAGNSINYEKDTKILSKSTVNIPNTAAWFKKQLVFDNVELRSVFYDLENYFHVKFEIVDQELLSCHFSGKFVDPSLRDLLSVLQYSLKISYTNKKGIYYINGKGCASH